MQPFDKRLRQGTHLVMLGPVWTVLIAVGMVVAAQNPNADTDEKVYDMGPGITQPRVTKQVMPHYPDRHGVKLEGSITLEVVVSSHGLPKNPRVVKGIEKDIDDSAIDAVSQWRFDPGKKDDKPVAVRVLLELEFHSM